jgi:hypothetical protein
MRDRLRFEVGTGHVRTGTAFESVLAAKEFGALCKAL